MVRQVGWDVATLYCQETPLERAYALLNVEEQACLARLGALPNWSACDVSVMMALWERSEGQTIRLLNKLCDDAGLLQLQN